jgi:hypothetical protein
VSFNVLVIPEDATLDHYLLKPLLSALVAAAGRPQARLRVLLDPAVKGVDQALDDAFLRAVIERYPMVDLFLLCVDRDGLPGRDASVADRETAAQALLSAGKRFLGVAAHQEAEVWCLAGMSDLPKEWTWSDVRAERDPKEFYYEPYAKSRGVHEGPGGGRELLGREAAGRYPSVRSRCPEVAALEGRVASV